MTAAWFAYFLGVIFFTAVNLSWSARKRRKNSHAGRFKSILWAFLWPLDIVLLGSILYRHRPNYGGTINNADLIRSLKK